MQELTKKAVKAPWGRFYGLFSCEEFCSSGKVSIFRSDRKVYRSKSGHDKPAYSLNKSADNSEHVRIYDDPLF